MALAAAALGFANGRETCGHTDCTTSSRQDVAICFPGRAHTAGRWAATEVPATGGLLKARFPAARGSRFVSDDRRARAAVEAQALGTRLG